MGEAGSIGLARPDRRDVIVAKAAESLK